MAPATHAATGRLPASSIAHEFTLAFPSVTDRTRARRVGLAPHHADPSKHPNESGDCAHQYRKLFVLLAKATEIAKYLTAVVATSAALDSVFRFNRKARTHEALCRGFTELSSKIAGWEPNSG
jgi:hypothetical protein